MSVHRTVSLGHFLCWPGFVFTCPSNLPVFLGVSSQHLGIFHCVHLPLAVGLLVQPSKGTPECRRYREGWRYSMCHRGAGRVEAEMQEVQPVGCSGTVMGCVALVPQLSWGAPSPSCALWPCLCRQSRGQLGGSSAPCPRTRRG